MGVMGLNTSHMIIGGPPCSETPSSWRECTEGEKESTVIEIGVQGYDVSYVYIECVQ